MVRLELFLSEEQYAKLRALAKGRGLSRADVVRQGIDLLLHERLAPRPSPAVWQAPSRPPMKYPG